MHAERQVLRDTSSRPAKKPSIHSPPKSSLLEQLHGFLPELKAANSLLESGQPSDLGFEMSAGR